MDTQYKINGNNDQNWSKKILFWIIPISGILLFALQVEYALLFAAIAALSVLFFYRPQYSYYLMIFTIPLFKRFRDFPIISFTINEVCIVICLFFVLLNIFLKAEKVDLRTSLDKWMIVLLALFFLAGITSESDKGLFASFKFLEAVTVYYLTVYFIRTKKAKISTIIKFIILIALIQALFGTLQSFTGKTFTFNKLLHYSARGYLGYLGIGSSVVWQGRGTMMHFNSLGYFLTLITLFFLPIYHYVLKNKLAGKIILFILLMGIITTYSRGSLIALYVGSIVFLSQIVKNKIRFMWLVILSAIVIGGFYLFLKETSYVQTLNPRDQIWHAVVSSITSSAKFTWFGAGLNSYNIVVWPYFRQDEQPVFAHDFYLLCVQEFGLIGAAILLSFFVYLFYKAWKNYLSSKKFIKILNLCLILALCEFFANGIFDHSYVLTGFKVILFLMIGIIYAKDKKFLEKPQEKPLIYKPWHHSV